MDPTTPPPTTPNPCDQNSPQPLDQPLTPQRPPLPQQKVTKLKLVSKTWSKDSYGLFDYQAHENQYETNTQYVEETTFIVRNNKTCETLLVKDLSEIRTGKEAEETQKTATNTHPHGKGDFTVLGELIVEKARKLQSFKLKPYRPFSQTTPSQTDLQKKQTSKRLTPFILADGGSPKSSGFPLQPGNIIKFGRVQYLVLESFNGRTTSSFRDSIFVQDDNNDVFDIAARESAKLLLKEDGKEQNEQNIDRENINCKICLCNEETEEDPLISPCKCKGYCGLIHTMCLRQWINNKVKKDTMGLATSYNFTKFQCEICKAPFPKVVRTHTDDVEMIKIDKPQKPYIMMESLDPMNNHVATHSMSSGEKEKLLHVISTDDKQPIRIGRANECEIRLVDISVSRKHAEIKLVDGDFYIKDTGAKFGTLVEWNYAGESFKGDIITINKKKCLKIQLGRTAYQLSVQDISEDIDTQ